VSAASHGDPVLHPVQDVDVRALIQSLPDRLRQPFLCTGTGPDFAAHCTEFAVYSSRAGSNTWTPTPAAATAGPGQAASAASLLLTGTAAYLLPPAGTLFAGPLTGAGLQPVQQVRGIASQLPMPCQTGPAQPDGQPSGALLAASGSAALELLCTGPSAVDGQRNTLYSSQDGGQTWQREGSAPAAGTAVFLSGSPSGALVLATSLGIEVSTDGGATWAPAGGTVPQGGFSYVGMTTATQGVAVPADPAQHAIWLTYDGGSTWLPSPVNA
jgi:hypothetical protein